MLGIFLDTETNGLNPYKHHILELAFKIVDVSTGEILLAYESIIAQSKAVWGKSDPRSLEINKFTWEILSKGKLPKLVQEEVTEIFLSKHIHRKNAIFICQNPSFDRAFFSQIVDPDIQEKLQWPYHWLDLASMFWAHHIQKGKENLASFPWETGVSKDRISMTYSLPCEAKPHRAMNGVDHLLLCYETIVGFPLLTKIL